MKPDYYVSRYLNVITLDGEKAFLLFNGVSGCLDEIPPELGRVLSLSDRDRLNALSAVNLELLAGRGHITTLSPEQELERFRELAAGLHNQQLKQLTAGGILLIPSYNCNLDCAYCFQRTRRRDNSGTVMTLELVDDIFEKHLPALLPGIANISLSLFGGEPFLPANEAVIRRALLHAERLRMSVVGVTNGTGIDAMSDIFGPEPGRVSKLQISFDGSRREHDRSRIPAGGGDTFDRILGNIVLLLEKGVYVDVRINVDRAKLETLPKLFEELRARNIAGNPRAYIYAYPLHDGVGRVDDSDFVGFGEVTGRIKEMGLEMECPCVMRASDARRLFRLARGIGLKRTAYCMQAWQNYLVIDPFGDIYACSEEAGYSEFRIGHIGGGGVEFFALRDVYKSRRLANLPDCLGCSVALACGGQCGLKCRTETGDLFKVSCGGLRSAILNAVKEGYQRGASGNDAARKNASAGIRLRHA